MLQRLATLLGWAELEAQVKRLDPEGWQEIAAKQARWEAKHRTHEDQPREGGRFTAGCDKPEGDEWDNQSARGDRRQFNSSGQEGPKQAATCGNNSINSS